MEVEKITPVATSPLDSCRGRGKHHLLPRLRSVRPRHSPKASADEDTATLVLLVIQEPHAKVGVPKDGCLQNGTH